MKTDERLVHQRDTLRLRQPGGSSSELPSYPSSLVQVDLAAMSHPGLVRVNNEDHYLIVRISRSLETLMTNLAEGELSGSFGETAYGMLVADGMGGMAAGEVASSMALRKLLELVVQTPAWTMRMNRIEDATNLMERMTERFRQVDAALRALGESNQALFGMGTTLTTAATLGTDLFLGHIGDSRAYIFGRGRLRQLTRDHTLSQTLIDAGVLLPEDEATSSMRHVLTAALGSTAERTDPQVQRLHLFDGDQLLLCTDGLTEMVDDQTISSVLGREKSAREACQALMDLALSGGGRDNITIALGRYHFPPTH